MRPRSRPGFTLVEALVVCAILSVLFALVALAVQMARAAAVRVGCADNMRNQGLAVLGYADTYGTLPPGAVLGPFPPAGVTTAAEHGLWPFLLPYLGETTLGAEYLWQASYYDPANQPVVTAQLKVLQCPGAVPNRFETAAENLAWEYGGKGACTDYAPISVNPFLADKGKIDPAANYGAALPLNGLVRVTDVTDGTSETLMIAEDAGRPQLWQFGRRGSGSVAGGPWASAANAFSLHTGEGCAIDCSNDKAVYGPHPGGANVVFVDGSVQFLNTNTSLRVLAALATRAGGEIIPAGGF